jgi:hypothetical protein
MLLCTVIPDIRQSIVLFEGSHAWPACPSDKIKMSTEHWWNDADSGQLVE